MLFSQRAMSTHLKAFATIDPNNLTGKDKGFNLVQGEWRSTSSYVDLIDPLTGKTMMKQPDTQMDEITPFVESLQACPKTVYTGIALQSGWSVWAVVIILGDVSYSSGDIQLEAIQVTC